MSPALGKAAPSARSPELTGPGQQHPDDSDHRFIGPASNQHDPDTTNPADETSYPPPSPSQPLLPPTNFSPFFTLVSDATAAASSGESYHHHPRVHYVFSDDDPDLHTAIFLRALGDSSSPAATTASPRHHHEHLHPHHTNAPDQHPTGDSLLPAPAPNTTERFIILDLAPDGHGVAGATSLSREWQVVDASIAPAPSFAAEDATEEESGAVGAALMLRVEGVEVKQQQQSQQHKALGVGDEEEVLAVLLGEARRKEESGDLVGGMEELLRRFEAGVEVLGKIVGGDVDVVVGEEGVEAEAEAEADGRERVGDDDDDGAGAGPAPAPV